MNSLVALSLRMIDHRQPLARAVRPVLAECAPLAELVREQPHPPTGVP
jgi:hypothetical protein